MFVSVIPGRAEGAGPESMTPVCDYGFQVRSLRSRPGITLKEN